MKLEKDHLVLAIHLAQAGHIKLASHEIAEGIVQLASCSNKLHHIYEAECNRGLTEHEKRLMSHLERHAKSEAERLGCEVLLTSDPRGATIRLVLPEGQTNDFGGQGWVV